MYQHKIRDAIASANSDYTKLMAQATGTSTEKHPQEEKMKDEWLMAEGFKPVLTPQKEVKWVPNIPQPSQQIAGYQKGQNSMSNETLVKAYPFLQHAIDNYIPVIDGLVSSVQSGDLSQQYLNEIIMKLMHEGVKEAVDATGGMSKQGSMQIAKAASAVESASILSRSSSAVKQIGGE